MFWGVFFDAIVNGNFKILFSNCLLPANKNTLDSQF